MNERPRMDSTDFRLIRDFIYERTGVWYTEDRTMILENRLSGRLAATGSHGYRDYYYLLSYGDSAEVQAAIDAVTNNETYFFREVAQLEASAALVGAAVAKRGFARVLSAGCASGEEPYSLAMLLHEKGLLAAGSKVEIVGIDINTSVLERARAARYGANSFRSTEGRYIDGYFEMRNGQMELAPDLRRATTYAHLSILDTERLKRMGPFDVVLCRNVLIYFDERAKRSAIESLQSVLKPGGHLFLGHSESLYRMSNEFELVTVEGAIGYRRPQPSDRGERARGRAAS